jgi:hypothetical protein
VNIWKGFFAMKNEEIVEMLEYLENVEDIKIEESIHEIIMNGLDRDQYAFYQDISDYVQDNRLCQAIFDSRIEWHFLQI